ncbi:mechanosensitive ion channel [Acetobacter sp. TBRC 12305]|uniref:Mechanosensitive ion channel n=2 Tax=Acetobacter garciniae TaxID=2817435 RepID=A0A939KPB0_9PROT|nr:mechanosensitive ion channel [Acetobacter garciniae]MBX0343398.1 mechanosensitive ion channel [Acetobacter garciniae]
MAAPVTTPAPFITHVADSVSDKTLDDMEAEIHAIYTTSLKDHETGAGSAELASLLRRATALTTQADTLIARIKPYQAMYQNFLDILGKPPGKDDPPEAPSLAEQRTSLLARQRDLTARLTRLRLYQVEARQLLGELRLHGSAIQQATLWQRFPSPLGVNFWSGLAGTYGPDSTRLRNLGQQAGTVLKVAFTGKRALMTLGSGAGALLLLGAWLACHRPIRRLVSHFLPDGPIRAIAATALCVSAAIAAWSLFFQITWNILAFDNPAAEGDLALLAGMIGMQVPLCAFVLEMGRCLLARQEQWRPVSIPDELARGLRLFPLWLAIAMLARGALRYMDTHSGLSLLAVQLLDGLYTLCVSPLLFAVPHTLRKAAAIPDEGTAAPLTEFAKSAAMAVAFLCCGAVLVGYVPLGYMLVSWLGIMSISLCGLFLLSVLIGTVAGTLFTANAPLGRRLVELGLPARLVNQACVVIPGMANVLALVVAYAIATSGANFDPDQIWNQLYLLFHGTDSAASSHVSLDAILLCAGLFIAGHYGMKILKSWFSHRLFPTTRLDIGAQASILSILSYAAWILIGLAALSILGVTVQSLTWVVSALSVGIGFGLQSIVQNFVSGIILMAERPVSVGDVVTIAGVTGTVERISVRSTDIQLDDKSIMIVPNSQFITSAVKNATRAQKPGVFTIVLDLPFASDLQKAMEVMTATLGECDAVDANTAPTVSMTAVADGSASVTGSAKARDGLDLKVARSTALFAIWQAFQDHDIPVMVRQMPRP